MVTVIYHPNRIYYVKSKGNWTGSKSGKACE